MKLTKRLSNLLTQKPKITAVKKSQKYSSNDAGKWHLV